jgi:hypothetical protein
MRAYQHQGVMRPRSGCNRSSPYSYWLPFSSFVVSPRLMADYNQHTRLLSFRVLLSMRCQVYSARRGADVVIQSIPLTMAVRLLESGSRSKLHALIRRGYGSGLVNPCAIHPAAQTSPPSAATWSPIGTPSSTIGYRNIFLKLKIITRDSVLSVIPINTITCL